MDVVRAIEANDGRGEVPYCGCASLEGGHCMGGRSDMDAKNLTGDQMGLDALIDVDAWHAPSSGRPAYSFRVTLRVNRFCKELVAATTEINNCHLGSQPSPSGRSGAH